MRQGQSQLDPYHVLRPCALVERELASWTSSLGFRTTGAALRILGRWAAMPRPLAPGTPHSDVVVAADWAGEPRTVGVGATATSGMEPSTGETAGVPGTQAAGGMEMPGGDRVDPHSGKEATAQTQHLRAARAQTNVEAGLGTLEAVPVSRTDSSSAETAMVSSRTAGAIAISGGTTTAGRTGATIVSRTGTSGSRRAARARTREAKAKARGRTKERARKARGSELRHGSWLGWGHVFCALL